MTKAVALLIKGRLRDRARMVRAAELMDRLRRKAPPGWSSVAILRRFRKAR